jgi:hypothetical protein
MLQPGRVDPGSLGQLAHDAMDDQLVLVAGGVAAERLGCGSLGVTNARRHVQDEGQPIASAVATQIARNV